MEISTSSLNLSKSYGKNAFEVLAAPYVRCRDLFFRANGHVRNVDAEQLRLDKDSALWLDDV